MNDMGSVHDKNNRTTTTQPVDSLDPHREVEEAENAAVEATNESRQAISEREQAATLLRRSEEHFRSLIENASDIITIIDIDGTIRYESPSVEHVLGFKPEELVGTNAMSLSHPGDARHGRRLMLRAMNGQRVAPFELRFKHKDGSWRTLEVVGKVVRDGAGAPQVIVNSRDITERKRSEDELRRQKELLQKIFDNVPVMISFFDEKVQTKLVNKEWERTRGWTLEEIKNPHLDIIKESYVDADERRRARDEILAANNQWAEFKTRNKNGEVIDTTWAITRLSDGTRVGIGQNITERKRADEEKFRLANHVQMLMDSTGEGIYGIDLQGNCTFINRAATEMLGYESEEALGRNMHDLVHHSGADGSPRPVEQCLIFQAFMKGQGCRVDDEVFWRRDGTSVPVEYSSFPMIEDGVIRGAVVTFVDITQRKQRERELLLANTILNTEQETSLDGILVVNHNHEMVSFNKNFVEMWGIPEEVLQSRRDQAALQSVLDKLESPDEFLRGVEQLYSTREQKLRDELKLKDGRVFDRYSAPMIGTDGNYYGRVFYFRDITQGRRAEQALRESEWRYRLLFESNPQPMWVYDLDTLSFLAVNEAAIRHYGYSREDFLSMTIADIRPPQDIPALTQALSELNGESNLRPSSWRHRKKDGTIIDVEITAHALDFSGKRAQLVLATDITERKQAEKALRESEELFRSLAETVSAAIYIYRDSRYIYLNPAAEMLSGYTDDELMGMEVWDIVHPAFRGPMKERSALRQLGEIVPPRSEIKIVTKHGETRWLDITASLIQFKGQPAVLATAFDITDRKGWEDALRESEEKYRTILESIQEGYYEVDLSGSFTFINDSLCRIVGSERERLIGLNNRDYTDAETARRLYAAFNHVFRSGEPLEEFQYQIVTRDGVQKFLETSILLRRDQDGKVSGFRGTVRDISERKQAEQALRESEARYKTLFEAATDAIMILDTEGSRAGRIVAANRAAAETTGYTVDELLNLNIADLRVPEQCERVSRDMESVLDGSTMTVEISRRRKDGSTFPVEVNASLVSLGDKHYILVFARDLTQRKQMEKEATMLAHTVRSIQECVSITDTENHVLFVNDAFVRTYGLERDELLGKKLTDLVRVKSERADTIDELPGFDPGQPWEGELFNRRKDGTVFPINLCVSPIRDDSGQTIALAGIAQDITERKKIEKEVSMLAQAIRSIQEAVVVTDPDGYINFVNDAAVEMYGYESDEAIGKHVSVLHSARNSAEFVDKVVSSARDARWEGEMLSRRKDGTEFPIHLSASDIQDENGQCVALIGVSQDITERRRSIEELQRAKEAAEAASRAKSEFLANMSHEIRTPMNGIVGMTELALDTELTGEQREYLKLVKLSSDSLLRVINDILDFSKIEAGKLELDHEEFSLQDNVDEVMKALGVRADQKGLELAYYLRPGVPDFVVGDVGRLRQILVNLVGNAIKFTEAGEVIVRIEIESQTEDQVVLHFCVRDTGIGVPIEKQAIIFESFTQADGSTTRKYGGTGLGLAISAQLVRAMNGRMWVESPSKCGSSNSQCDFEKSRALAGMPDLECSLCGIGSMFHFTAVFDLPKTAPVRSSPVDLSTLRAQPVLVVDDNATNRRILEVQLAALEMKPVTVANAAEALDAIRHAAGGDAPFKLVLTDLHMPDVDGAQLAELIRRTPEADDLKIIMMSSAIRENHDRQDPGVAAHLTKPVKASDLVAVIRSVLGKVTVSQNVSKRPHAILSPHPARVLVAEDSPVNQEFMKRLLIKWGHSVVIADNGRLALSLLDAGRFDVVLMDVQMPEVNGYGATQAIRSKERGTGAHIPIIALTAHALKGDRDKCIDAGMDDYISKPVEADKLFAAVENAIARSGMSNNNGHEPARVLDADSLMLNLDGDIALLQALADIFTTSAPTQLSELEGAISRHDADAIMRCAHTLKGSVATFQARAAVDAAAALERIGGSGDLSNADPAFEELSKELKRLTQGLKELIGKVVK